MITRTILMTLAFAVIIGFGATAFALMNGSPTGFAGTSYSTSFFNGGDNDNHDDDDD